MRLAGLMLVTGVSVALFLIGLGVLLELWQRQRDEQAGGREGSAAAGGAVEQDGEITAATWQVSPDKTESTLLRMAKSMRPFYGD